MRRRAKTLAAVCLLATGVAQSVAADSAPTLLHAVKRQDWNAAAMLLDRGADAESAEPDGTTALHWAAHWGDAATADRLIKAGADVAAANRYGVTPLSVAASAGQVELISRLLTAGADPNTATREGETVLMSAARTGNVESIKMLLVHGADVHAVEGWRGQTALMWAAAENQIAAVNSLLSAGASVDAKSKRGFTALLFAVRAGHLELARLLLASGADVNSKLPDGTSALVLAALNAHWEMGVLLLEKGADANADGQGWAALHQVALTRSPHHDNVNPQPIPTGKIDSLDFVNALISHGVDVNLRTKKSPTDRFRQWIRREGATPFFLAAKAADLPLMRLLIANGADPLIPTNRQVTPLAAAAGVGYCQGESPGTDAEALEAVKYLMSLGGDVDTTDSDGFTPMHGAAARGANSIVQFLHDHGARLDPISKQEKWTPWTMANGVMLADTYKRQLSTADYLRDLMDRAQPAVQSPIERSRLREDR